MGREEDLRLARPLRMLVMAALVCDILAIIYLPVLLTLRSARLWALAGGDDVWSALGSLVLAGPTLWIFVAANARSLVLAVAVALCGVCAAVLLVYARRILVAIERQQPFCRENAKALGMASWACFGVSLIALVRLGLEVVVWGELAALATYNALAVPVFFLGGLLFRVMAALFHQAVRMKEEQELTI